MSHRVRDVPRLESAALAFIAFCFASSAGYIFNDIIDLEHDRRHRSKHQRPLGSGEISHATAIVMMIVVAALSLLIAALIGRDTLLGIAIYLVLFFGWRGWKQLEGRRTTCAQLFTEALRLLDLPGAEPAENTPTPDVTAGALERSDDYETVDDDGVSPARPRTR